MARITTATAALMLLCAVATQASRIALEQDFSDADFIGRGLLQRNLDCTRVHRACSTCRNQRKAGTRASELICSTCKNGWRLRRDGQSKTCDCAPGMYMVNNECVACTRGKFCLGGDSINTASAASDCPDGLASTFEGAKSQQQCFTQAGYGRSSARGNNGKVDLVGQVCPVGTYNVGGNTAGCQRCPAGLTTRNSQTAAPSDCLAPAGSYVDKGIGKLCPKGTYSTDLNSAPACTACPDGITTAAEGSKSAIDCQFAKRGFYLTSDTTAEPCPLNTFNDGETLKYGDSCKACPNGWKTKLVGADGEALCLAPPGFELKAGADQITECDMGSYKADWNRNNCTVCGTNLITSGTGSVSKDACLVPRGYGIASLDPLSAQMCVSNSYGQSSNRPTSAAARCTTCAPNTFTDDTLDSVAATAGYTDEIDCKVAAGWGMTAGGLAEKCRKGTYNAGKNRLPCTACPAGYTTLEEAATSANDCVIQPGWYLQTGIDGTKPAPCDVGTYSPGGDANIREPTTCTPCPTGYSTQTDESVSADDCQVCAAGYGGTGCVGCGYNTYSYGGQKDGGACTGCATGSVSRRRSQEADMCYARFQDTVRDVFSTSGTWTPAAGTIDDAPACAEACRESTPAACMTYRFNAASKACDLFLESGSGQDLYFKLNNGADYAKYTIASGITFGVEVSTASAADATECLNRCKATGDCEVASMVGTSCSLRQSELDSEYTGMWVVAGNKLVTDAGM